MKTLRGEPIEGDLLKLYNYYFAPDGGEEEAFQLARANKLGEQFYRLITQQYDDAGSVFETLATLAAHSQIVDYGEDAAKVFVLRDSEKRTILSQHRSNGPYEFGLLIRVAVKVRPSIQSSAAVRFATREEAKTWYLCDSLVELFRLNMDSLPAVFSEKADLRDKTADTAKRVAVAIQQALHKLQNTQIGIDSFIDAQNIVVKTNLDDYPSITYIDNFKAVFAH